MKHHQRHHLLSLTFLIILLAACSGSAVPSESPTTGSPTNTPIPNNTLAATMAATSTPTVQPSPTSTPTVTPEPVLTPDPQDEPAVKYHITAILDYDLHSVDVDQEVTYTNTTGQELNEIVMVAQPAEYPRAFRILDGSNADGKLEILQTGSTLSIKLPSSLEVGSEVTFNLSYTLSLPVLESALEKGPVPFGYTTNQTNLVDWYPFIPAVDTDGNWIVRLGNEYGEHLVYETAAYEVDLTVKGNWAKLFVAASGPAEMRSKVYHYELPAARSFAITVSHLYEQYTQQVGSVTVVSYVFPIHKKAGEQVLKTTVEALQLYEELFGPYPHPMLTVVEADFLDGMEYDGLYFLSRGFYNLYSGTPGEYLVAIAAHETAHQWWYARVGNDQALEPWLDEALCTYSEKLYYERYSPDGLKWWWEYRVAYYHPEGWVDTQIYPSSGHAQTYNQYRDAVYLRGAQFLEELRKQVGDEAFFAFLKDYVAQYGNKIATREDFFHLLADHSQVDISGLVSTFFEK